METTEMNILYLHGMGGGGDSRIPGILEDYFSKRTYVREGRKVRLRIMVRTYDFDPEVASGQIQDWIGECRPCLIIGESLGSIHAIRIKGLPHLLVSPSLGAPLWLGYGAPLARVPGIPWLLGKIYRGRDGDRQKMVFTYPYLKKYRTHGRKALENTPAAGSPDYFFAFFGKHDHYRRSGVVSIRRYRKFFGNQYAMYDGTHFMEEEFLYSLLVPKILEVLQLKKTMDAVA